MTQENVEALEALYAGWARGDFQGGVELFAPSVVKERQYGRGRASGLESESSFYAVWTFRDGLVTQVRWEADRELAFEAARD